jgi:hypothetical protein
MKKRTILSAAAVVCLFGATSLAAYADQITVNTSCGKTVTIESTDYNSGQEAVDAVIAIDKALCPDADTQN